MPELPEVEIVRVSLEELVRGRLIEAASLHRRLLCPSLSPGEFNSLIAGRRIDSVGRRGKHLLINLEGELTLIVHLRMSGRFSLLSGDEENPKFTHAEFFLDTSERLVFEDQRHFGYMNLVSTDRVSEAREIRKLAPEPFSGQFSREYLRDVLGYSTRKVKELLVDQTKVCGLGNIYACEALFLARLHPETRSCEVSSTKAFRLHRHIVSLLEESVREGLRKRIDRTNIEDRYFNGSSGGDWLVYDREGKPCTKCGSAVRRVKQGGRSSFYCPRCQRKPRAEIRPG